MYYKDCANLSKLMIGSNFCVCNGCMYTKLY